MQRGDSLVRIRLLLLFCVVVWGWTFVASKICLSYVTPVELVGLRFLIGLPVLGSILLVQRIPLRFSAGDFRQIVPGPS